MISDSKDMMNRDEKVVEAEIVLFAILASSMILLTIHPLIGKIMCLISAGLFVLFYLAKGYDLLANNKNENPLLFPDAINYIAAVIVIMMLMLNALFFGNLFVPGLIAVLIPSLCLAMNLSKHHLYWNRNSGFALKQIRMLILLALSLILIFAGRNLN